MLVKMVAVCAVLYLYVKPIILICLLPKKEVHDDNQKDDDFHRAPEVPDGQVELGEFESCIKKEGLAHGTNATEIFIH
jgi:hypothetical protein